MVRYRYGRRRHRRLAVALVLLLSLAVLLVSCVAGGGSLWLLSLFGADLQVYAQEPVLAQLPADGPMASGLCEAVAFLNGGSVDMPVFRSPAKAVRLYRDAILGSLLSGNYAAYVGNAALMEEVSRSYPHLTAAVLVPDSDFENAAAQYLGAGSVSNRSGRFFTYLSRADCYTIPSRLPRGEVSVVPVDIAETEHTYRMRFTLTDSEGNSAAYTALFLKRSEGSPYLRALGTA